MDEPKNITISAKVPESLFLDLDQARHLEDRTMSNMVYVLLKEAIVNHLLEPRSTRGLSGEPSSLEGAENQEPGSHEA